MPPRSVKNESLGLTELPRKLGDRTKTLWTEVTSGPQQDFDLTLVCLGGEVLRCHRAVIASASSFLATLLQSPEVQTREGWVRLQQGQEATLVLDQVRARDLRRLLCLLYNGYADVTLEAAGQLKEVWKHLDINIVKLQQPQIDVVDQKELAARPLARGGTHFTEPSTKQEPCSLEEEVLGVKQEVELEDPDADPDDPVSTPVMPVKKLRGPASKRKYVTDAELPSTTKRVRAGVGTYTVEEVHVCKMCHGKDPVTGKVDKEALNLSFRELKKLVGHYGKHLYDEGKVFKYVPLGADNVDKGEGIDQFGKTFRYKCGFKTCWKSVKGECGYKEFALHMISDHDALEPVLRDDPRQELQTLLSTIQQVKEQQREANQPRQCAVPGCEEREREHIKDGEYRTLRNHYALTHWKRWFERAAAPGEGPRTQRLTKTGAHCQVCNLKLFGDDAKMIEHYAVVHKKLEAAILDTSTPVVGEEGSLAVLKQLFPDLLTTYKGGRKK